VSDNNCRQRQLPRKRSATWHYCSSGDARWSPGLSISAPIFLDTFGACPVVSRRGSPAASSGTVTKGGLFGVVLCKAVGAFVLSWEG
jgi:hypothetical protein